jgi:hypothetical protein
MIYLFLKGFSLFLFRYFLTALGLEPTISAARVIDSYLVLTPVVTSNTIQGITLLGPPTDLLFPNKLRLIFVLVSIECFEPNLDLFLKYYIQV